jgi:hypothetical protein
VDDEIPGCGEYEEAGENGETFVGSFAAGNAGKAGPPCAIEEQKNQNPQRAGGDE